MKHPHILPLPYAPTETSGIYPESDGKPMADTSRHFREIVTNVNRLGKHFEPHPDVYVHGDMLMYYEAGNPRKSIDPDLFVSFGVGKKERRTYNVWEEGKPPDFVLEFSSKGTYRKDLTRKVEIYTLIGIREYFLYDVERRYLPRPLMGYRLVQGAYAEIPVLASGGLPAVTLGLEFHDLDEGLGIYDPVAEGWLQSDGERAEDAEERAEDAEERAEDAEERAAREADARHKAEERAAQEADALRKAEAETARLQAELERLKART